MGLEDMPVPTWTAKFEASRKSNSCGRSTTKVLPIIFYKIRNKLVRDCSLAAPR